MSSDVEHRVHRQTEAAKKLLRSMRDEDAADEELVTDTIEGETGLFEAIDAALSEIDECEILITGLKKKEQDFEARRKSAEVRADRIRAMIEQAMIATEQQSIRLPSATVSLRTIKPGVVITNEADIPARFWIEQERPAPKLDKKALAEALKTETITGASLDNGGVGLSVRRK